jgi:5-methylcytosine-specific restriction endonuclease McrA
MLCQICDAKAQKDRPFGRVHLADGKKHCSHCGVVYLRSEMLGGICLPCRRIYKGHVRSGDDYIPKAQRDAQRGHITAMKKVEHLADALRSKYARSYLSLLAKIRSQNSAEEDKERHRYTSKKRYYSNLETERQRVRIYKHSNPEVVAGWDARRGQRVLDASDGTLTQEVIGKMFAKAVSCPYCGVDLTAGNKSLDHIVPLSRGGAHSRRNVVICCWECNQRKQALPFPRWFSQLVPAYRKNAARLYFRRTA